MLCLHQDIESSYRLRDRNQGKLGHAKANDYPQECSKKTQDGSLGKKQDQNSLLRDAQTSENSNLPTSTDHRNGHGIVDQKHTHEERDETQSRQVQSEGPDHVFHLGVASLRSANHKLRREVPPQGLRDHLRGSSRSHNQIDSVQ